MNKTDVIVKGEFLLLTAVSVIFIPLPWLISWLIAAAVHELFHVLALLLFKHHVTQITIGTGGTIMETNIVSVGQSVVCSLAGPLGGILLFCFHRTLPRLAVCGLIQSIYNLLPLMPLDGGQVLFCILKRILEERFAHRAYKTIERVCFLILFYIGIYALLVLQMGIIPLVMTIVMFIRSKKDLANIGGSLYNICS